MVHNSSANKDRPEETSGSIEAGWKWHDETNALIRAAIESANDAIIITERELNHPGPRIEYVNPAFTEMTGYTLDEVLGKTPRILQGPRTDRGLLVRLRDDLGAGRTFHGETINYRKDGTEYVVEWRITGMRDAHGNVLKWVAVQRDVTERRRAENAREQTLAAERAARAQAEQISHLKDEFLATLSHELRTPIHAILGWTRLLRRNTLSPSEQMAALETIDRNAQSQARLIEDLLDMNRIVSGNVRLQMERTSLQPVVAAALQALQPIADAKGINLLVDFQPDTGLVNGDLARLQQVVWNLVSNSIKFTPAGGDVMLRLLNDGASVKLVVTDTGQGIAPAFLPLVFDRFRQADSSTTRRFGGLGLGLSIVKQLVELHGGSIGAESPGEGKGATFTVALPVVASAVMPAVTSAPPTTPLADDTAGSECDLSGLSFLVVDDEPDARALLVKLLRPLGARVAEAASGEEALGLLNAAPVDIIISDIGMPMMDGHQLIRQLRARSAGADRRFAAVALTAFARPEDRRRALLAGFDSYVAKPVDTAELVTVIASVSGRIDRVAGPAEEHSQP